MIKKIFFDSTRKLWKSPKTITNYAIVRPGYVSNIKHIPDFINKPDYFESGTPTNIITKLEIKNEEQIKCIRDSCKLASKILNDVGNQLKVGQTTDEIDTLVHEYCLKNDAYPSPFNYRGYPKSVCTSVNNVVCHGIPDDRPLQDGDIINIDITVFLNDYHGDCSKTFLVGNVDEQGIKLVQATEKCLMEAIELCKPGLNFCAIGNFIQDRARSFGFDVVPSLLGHGIGRYFHGPPDIYHCRNNYPGKMDSGMTFTIEPALSEGTKEIVILDDGWTAVTVDDSRSAQFEHTVLITKTGVEVLTAL